MPPRAYSIRAVGSLAVNEEATQALKRELSTATKVAILGIGNELYGSDSPGLLAAKEIEKSNPPDKYQVFLAGTAPENFTGAIRELSPSHVIFIDAADMGKKPGTIEVIDKDSIADVSPSTHNLSPSLLASYLTQEIGCKVIMLGIQPEASFPKGKVVEEAIKS